ncbi:hypothetical protein E4U14_003591 [Claviceps sp. LM454 group G7]|nr:hypothetical protein E4U14_003591 [Claviceps sp. LM454 group G7]
MLGSPRRRRSPAPARGSCTLTSRLPSTRLIMLDTMLIFGCALSLPNRLSLWRPVVLSAPKIARAMRQGCSALLVWPPAPVPRMMAVQSILNEIMRGGD